MNKLKSCPFCGSEAEFERIGCRRRSTIIKCTDCGCTLETGEEWDHGGQWSARQTPEEYLILPKEPPLKLIADLYYKGDIDMAIGNASITEEFEQDYKKALENYVKDNPCNSENTNHE